MTKMLGILKFREEHNQMNKNVELLHYQIDMIQMTTVLFHYLYNKHAQ